MPSNKLLTILTPVLIFVLLQIIFLKTSLVYAGLLISSLGLLITIKRFSKQSRITDKWINFFIFPFLFLNTSVVYSLFLTKDKIWLIELIFLLNLFVLNYFLKNAYDYLFNPGSYKKNSLENLFSYGNFLIIFFLSSTVYGLQTFLGVNSSLLILIFVVLNILIIYQFFYINRINIKDNLVYLFISVFILAQISWSLYFLPLNFNLTGLILAICYYMIAGTVKSYLKNNLSKKILKLYLSFGFGSIFFILLSANWIEL